MGITTVFILALWLAAFVGDAGHQPAAGEFYIVMFVQGDDVAGLGTHVVTFGDDALAVTAFIFEAVTVKGCALGVFLVTAGVVVFLVFGDFVFVAVQVVLAMMAVLKAVARVLKGVVAHAVFVGLELFGIFKGTYGRFGLLRSRFGIVGEFTFDGAVMQAVAEDQMVLVFVVFKVKHQAFFGGQSFDEVEVGFTVLDAVFADAVVVLSIETNIVAAIFFQQGGDNANGVLLLKDAAVAAQSGARQFGFNNKGVMRASKPGLSLAHTRDDAVDASADLVVLPQGEGHGLIQQLTEVNVGVGAGGTDH